MVYTALSPEGKNDEGVEYLALQENGIDYVNYWVQGCELIRLGLEVNVMEEGEEKIKKLEEAEEKLQNMMDTFQRNDKFPRPPYAHYPYGWVSSMDAPTIMIGTQMLYELTGKEAYKDFIEKLGKYVLKDVPDGGFNLTLDDGNIWPLEYAEESMIQEEDNYFVLNGSMVGYIGCKAMGTLLEDKELLSYCKRIEKSYETRFPRYRYSNYNWTFYMLNPETVIPPHYMIFEMKLMDAAYMLTSNKMFLEEKEFRSMAFSEVLALHIAQKDKDTEYILNRACAPHPYLIDLYGTKIEFLDKNKHIISTDYMGISGNLADDTEQFYKGQFMEGVLPKGSAFYRVYTYIGSEEYLLFEKEIEVVNETSTMPYEIEPTIRFDGEREGDVIRINADLNTEKEEAQIVFAFEEPEQMSIKNQYGMEVENLGSNALTIGLLLYDTEGNGAGRYYTPLKPGKNLILFHEIGFRGVNEVNEIAQIVLRIYTNTMEEQTAEVRMGNLYQFQDTGSLSNYIAVSDYKISPQ